MAMLQPLLTAPDKVSGHRLHALIASARLLGQAFEQHAAEAFRQVGDMHGRRCRLDRGMHMPPVRRVARRQGRLAGQGVIKNARQRVDIAALIETGAIAPNLLGGQVGPVLQRRKLGDGARLLVGVITQKAHRIIGAHPQVPGQQIGLSCAGLPGIDQRMGRGDRDGKQAARRQARLTEQIRQGHARLGVDQQRPFCRTDEGDRPDGPG